MQLFIISVLAFLAIIRLLSYFLYLINCSYYFPYVIFVLYMLSFILFRVIFFLSVKELNFEEIVKNKYKWDEIKQNSKLYKYLLVFCYICIGKPEEYYDRYFTKVFVFWQLYRYMFQLYTFTEWFSCILAKKAKSFEIELKYFFYVVVYDYLEERYLFVISGFSRAHRITFLIHAYNRYRKTRRVKKSVRFSTFYTKFRYVILHYSIIILWFCPAKNLYSYRWKTSFLEFKANTLQRFLKETAEFIEMNPTTGIMSNIYDPIDQIPGDGNTFLPWPYFIDVSFRGSEYGDGDGNDEYDIYNLYMYDSEEFEEFEIEAEFGNGAYLWHTDDLLEGQSIKDLGYEEEYITLGMNEDEVPEYIPPFTEYFFDEVELLTRLDNDVVINSYAVNISAVFLVFGFFAQIAFSIILLSRRLQIFLYLQFYRSVSLFVTIAFVYFVKFASGLTFFMFIIWFPLQLVNLNYLPWHIYFVLEIIVKYIFK